MITTHGSPLFSSGAWLPAAGQRYSELSVRRSCGRSTQTLLPRASKTGPNGRLEARHPENRLQEGIVGWPTGASRENDEFRATPGVSQSASATLCPCLSSHAARWTQLGGLPGRQRRLCFSARRRCAPGRPLPARRRRSPEQPSPAQTACYPVLNHARKRHTHQKRTHDRSHKSLCSFGGPSWTRTSDRKIMSPLL